MEQTIGEIAGEVWDFLEEQEQHSVSGIARALDAPQNKVNMALGWLAREGNLEFVSQDRGTGVRLAGEF